jgi:phospholipase/carboxylesterase
MQQRRDGAARRWFLARWFLATGLAIGAACTIGCASARTEPGPFDTDQAQGRLHARPGKPSPSSSKPFAPGEQPLALNPSKGRDGLIYVPKDLPADAPVPLIVLLHGARGGAKGITTRVGAYALADQLEAIVLAPDSRDGTWDVIHGGFGPDIAFLDHALADLFARVAIDPKRVGIGGFSDGASYALSLGLINGDLFTHVLAFSPGFFVARETHGRPSIFVSHGTSDEILPIDSTSHRLVPALRDAGYPVQFRVFAGPHTVPTDIAREAFQWMLAPAAK